METTQPEKNKGGRPKGSMNVRSREAIERAAATGELPHEFLLRVARGEVISHPKLDAETGEITTTLFIPPWGDRIEAAKNVAPYFAAKLQAVEVTTALDDVTLDQLIQQYAAEAGAAIAVSGESTPQQDSPGPRSRVRINPAALAALAVSGQG